VPLTNYAGWLLVALVMMAVLVTALHRALGTATDRAPSGPAAALYLWTYGSSVLAHLVFFDLPGSALVGGLGMGLVAVPFARVVLRAAVSGGIAGRGISWPARAAARPAPSGRTR
jgi:putative membrane protein